MSKTWGDSKVAISQYGRNILIENHNESAGKKASTTQGRITLGGDAPPGYLNPINVRTTMQVMNIDSRFRDNYYLTSSGKFRINLAEPQKKVVSLRLSALEMPLTHYTISAKQGNNTMLVLTDTPNSDTAWRVRLPDGNYENGYSKQSNALSIEHGMNNALALAEEGTLTGNIWQSSVPPSGDKLTKYVRYVVDHASGKSSFAAKDDTDPCAQTGHIKGFRFNVQHNGDINTNTNIQLRLGWQLGFRAGAYDASACVSEAPCCISGPKYGFISVNDYQNNVSPTCVVNFSESTLSNNILGRFSLAYQLADNGIFQTMTDSCLVNPSYAVREYFGPVNIQKLEFTLYDDVGNILDLNNCDWSCSLVFEKQYE